MGLQTAGGYLTPACGYFETMQEGEDKTLTPLILITDHPPPFQALILYKPLGSSRWGGRSSWGMSLAFPSASWEFKPPIVFNSISVFLFLFVGQRKPRFWPPTNTRARVQSLIKKLKFHKMNSLKTNKQTTHTIKPSFLHWNLKIPCLISKS